MKKVKSLQGVLEYDNWALRDDDYPRCNIRLTLLDLSVGAIVAVRTTDEMVETPRSWSLYKVNWKPIVRIFKVFPGQWQKYSVSLLLAPKATMKVEVFDKYQTITNHITYRIDAQKKRPVRESHLKMTMILTDEIGAKSPYGQRSKLVPNYPHYSLWKLEEVTGK